MMAIIFYVERHTICKQKKSEDAQASSRLQASNVNQEVYKKNLRK